METVRAYVARMNRPLNATNVGDALGASGVKKGLAQKYLDALVDNGSDSSEGCGQAKGVLRDAGRRGRGRGGAASDGGGARRR